MRTIILVAGLLSALVSTAQTNLVTYAGGAGMAVTAGQALARLDPADLQLSRQAALAQVAAAESEFTTASSERTRYADLLA